MAPGSTLADAPNLDLLAALTAEMVLHVVGVRIDGPRADGRVIELDVVFTDVDESFALTVAHGALSHPRGDAARGAGHGARAAARVPGPGRRRGDASPTRVAAGAIEVEGDARGARRAARAARGAARALPDRHALIGLTER